MKPNRSLFTIVLLLAAVSAANAAAPRDVVVLDFPIMPRNSDGSRQRGYEYGFGDWEDARKKVVQILDKGLLIHQAGSKGGIGSNTDLDFRKHSRARIDLIIGSQNQADSFSFSLADRDGTDQSWEIPLKDQPVGQPLGVLLDLTKGREDKPGKNPALDLKKLASWQIKGNYQDKPIEILIIRVTAVSE